VRTASLLLGWALGACGSPGEGEVTVYAAASLRDALAEAIDARPGGGDVHLNLGSSGDLARQIVAGGRADLFLSADELELDRVERAGLVEAGTRRRWLGNALVVVVPADAPAVDGAFDLSSVGRLSIAHPEAVPAGRYARAWLESQGLWNSLRERVLPGVDVRAALAAVESGAAGAGIVYRTDAARSKRVKVVRVVPAGEGPAIVYAAAAIRGCGPAARALLEHLVSARSAVIFARHGFETP